MSLITIQRSPTPTDSTEDSSDIVNDLPIGKNEDFFTSSGTVILQNQSGRRRSSVIKEEDSLQFNLKKTVELLRKEDSLKLMINLEKTNWKTDGYRYFCVISKNGNHDSAEFLILGINVSRSRATIGLVLPICQDMSVKLDGDGGFKIKYKDGEKLFKPTSVHALWSTVQLLNKAYTIAHKNNYYIGGLNHSWIEYYSNRINSNRSQIAEWNRMLDADTIANSNLAPKSAIGEYVIGTEMDEHRENKEAIRIYLGEIMREEDMDNVTIIYLREKLQKKMSFNVGDYRRFIAEEILIIYGKMDESSKILPYLYLGSTYNASNLEELLKNGISHIINVTRESENFFREKFAYKNVEVFDDEDTKLLEYFDSCYKFINEAKFKNGSCLVHCQRGISRSATIVISYLMKEFNWIMDDAFSYVKERRDCIQPNDGFLQQLKIYEGILQASLNRHNLKFQEEKKVSEYPACYCPIDSNQLSYESVLKQSIVTEIKLPDLDKKLQHSLMHEDNKLYTSEGVLMSKELFFSENSDFSYMENNTNNEFSSPDPILDVKSCEFLGLNNSVLKLENQKIGMENKDELPLTNLNANISSEVAQCIYSDVENKSHNEIPLSPYEQLCDISHGSSKMDDIVDQQSLRPVRELLDRYAKQ